MTVELSCTAKLARVVLDERGPLSPPEVAAEAHLTEREARTALAELERHDEAEPVCGVAATREQVYAIDSQA